jgi:hypothetical protein
MTGRELEVLEAVDDGRVRRTERGAVWGANERTTKRLEVLELIEWMGPTRPTKRRPNPARFGLMRLTDAGRTALDELEART